MTQYTVEHRFIDNTAVITVSGGCEEHCARKIEETLDRLIAKGYRRFILDVADLSFAETPGYRLLIRKVGELQDLGGNLIVIGLSGKVLRVFDLVGLRPLVPTADSAAEAIDLMSTFRLPESAVRTHAPRR